jgi:hypothetical protein
LIPLSSKGQKTAALIHFFFFRMGSHSPFHMVKSFLGEKDTLLLQNGWGGFLHEENAIGNIP